jgi:regulator of protease activity HflC (stomatin/prohibitin superfamily)
MVAAFLMLIVITVVGEFTTVDATEHCVETRYGKIVQEQMPTGFAFLFLSKPTCFPITDQNYPEQQGVSEEFESQTRDPVTLKGNLTVVYHYQEIPALFREKRTPEAAQTQMHSALREAIASATAQFTIAQLFGPARGAFGDSVKAIAQRKAGKSIVFRQVFVSNLHAPPAIENARIIAAKKEQELDAALKQLQIDSANSQGVRIKAEADALRQRLEAQALATSPEVLKLRAAQAMAEGLGNACRGAQTCIIGGSVMDTWRTRP